MSTTEDVDLGRTCVGNTDRIQFSVNKDAVGWASLDAATLTFVRPDGSTFDRAMARLATNTWYYDTTTSDFDQAGYWWLRVHVTQGGITKKYPYEITLEVVA
jgi:hypothetical protein